jgi:hypothetical protein
MAKVQRTSRPKKTKSKKVAAVSTHIDDVFIIDDEESNQPPAILARTGSRVPVSKSSRQDGPIVFSELIEKILSGEVTEGAVKQRLKSLFVARKVEPIFLELNEIEMPPEPIQEPEKYVCHLKLRLHYRLIDLEV